MATLQILNPDVVPTFDPDNTTVTPTQADTSRKFRNPPDRPLDELFLPGEAVERRLPQLPPSHSHGFVEPPHGALVDTHFRTQSRQRRRVPPRVRRIPTPNPHKAITTTPPK